MRRQAPAIFIGVLAALCAALPAFGDSISQKRAQAQSVLGQVQQLDSSLGRAIEAYNFATVKLDRVRQDLRQNGQELTIAKSSLKRAQAALTARLVALYTSGNQNSSLEVVLGATNLSDLLNRLDTETRVSDQDAKILREVVTFDRAVKAHRIALKKARLEAANLVAERASERRSIESQLAQRRSLLSSIRGQIASLEAQQRAQALQLRRELLARQAAQARAASVAALTQVVAAPVTPGAQNAPVDTGGSGSGNGSGSAPAPAATHGGVVGIAERYLGVPYVWGGASPSGFDCSGLVMYAFAQIGVSLPHSSYAQYGYGTPVSRSQLQPGDLVFFDGLGHVGIYVGAGSFIHAPHTGTVVQISSMSGWYSSSFVGARRI